MVQWKPSADRGLRQSSLCFICPHSADCEPLVLGEIMSNFEEKMHYSGIYLPTPVSAVLFFSVFLQTKTPL